MALNGRKYSTSRVVVRAICMKEIRRRITQLLAVVKMGLDQPNPTPGVSAHQAVRDLIGPNAENGLPRTDVPALAARGRSISAS